MTSDFSTQATVPQQPFLFATKKEVERLKVPHFNCVWYNKKYEMKINNSLRIKEKERVMTAAE